MHAKKKPTVKCWYLDYPLGINTITPLVKELVHCVGVKDGNNQDQSLRPQGKSITNGIAKEDQVCKCVKKSW